MADHDARYARLHEIMMEVANLQSAYNLMDWELAVGGTPPGAHEHRTEMMASIESVVHAKKTSSEYGDLLESLLDDADEGNLGHVRSAIVREARRAFQRDRRLPAEFVERLTAAQLDSQEAYKAAKDASDWASVLPHFEQVVALTREETAMLHVHESEPYDTLLPEYDRSLTAAKIERAFADLTIPLTTLAARIREAADASRVADQAAFDAIKGVRLDDQRHLVRTVAEALGFDHARGVIGESTHPFTLLVGRNDTRFTSSYHADDVSWAAGTAAHETGHWLYADGLPPEAYGTLAGEPPSFSVDEGIARFYENVIGRSEAFMTWLMTHLPRKTSPAAAYRAFNRVQVTPLRIGSSEAVYDLHIMMRFGIERPLVNGALLPKEVPDAWRAFSKELLGIVPKDHKEGVLQDDHWFAGCFGYFPTYAFGNLFASHLAVAVRRDIPDLDERIARGEFRALGAWMQEHVFRHGGMLSSAELARAATGEDLNPAHHAAHLTKRYGAIYGF